MNNKRAQVSETMTWIVATIIIIIMLLVSVFLASLVGKNKAFPIQNDFDLFEHKSFMAYLMTKDTNGQTIYDEIKNDGDLNDFNGNFANKIFVGLYSGFYNQAIFLGINQNTLIAPMQNNKYFTIPPGETPSSLLRSSDDRNIVVKDAIPLNENKLLQMILWHTN